MAPAELLDPCEALAQVGLLFGFKPLDPEWSKWCEAMHPPQRAAACDMARTVPVQASRRAGKTEQCIYWLARDWLANPRRKSLYVASTIGSAREIIWDRLHDFDEQWNIGIEFHETRLEAKFPNGYTIIVTGCENKKQASRVARGKRFVKVVLDELEIWDDALVRYFIRSALKPTLMDFGGRLMLMGTPGNAWVGYWYEVTRNPEAANDNDPKRMAKPLPTHRFSVLQNPFVDAEAFFLEELEESGYILDDTPAADMVAEIMALRDAPITVDDPRWARILCRLDPEFIIEYLGIWIQNDNARIYAYDSAKNTWDDENTWDTEGAVRTVIGVDIGDRDGCGFSVVQKRWDGDEIRVLEAYCTVNLDNDELAAEIRKLMTRYRTHHVFMDSKGHGATSICKSMVNYRIPAEPAENNHKKLPLIRDTKAVLRNGRLKLHPVKCRDLIIQLKQMVWNEDRDSHQEGIPDEAIDATLWAVFEVKKLAAEAKKGKEKLSAEEYEELQEKLENMRAERNAERLVRLGNPTHRARPSKGRRTTL